MAASDFSVPLKYAARFRVQMMMETSTRIFSRCNFVAGSALIKNHHTVISELRQVEMMRELPPLGPRRCVSYYLRPVHLPLDAIRDIWRGTCHGLFPLCHLTASFRIRQSSGGKSGRRPSLLCEQYRSHRRQSSIYSLMRSKLNNRPVDQTAAFASRQSMDGASFPAVCGDPGHRARRASGGLGATRLLHSG